MVLLYVAALVGGVAVIGLAWLAHEPKGYVKGWANDANRLHHDEDARPFELSEKAIAKAEGK